MNFTKKEKEWIVNSVKLDDSYIIRRIEDGMNITTKDFIFNLHQKLNEWLEEE